MKTSNQPADAAEFDYMSASMDDIVFRYRNKAYGAWVLRNQYDRNVVKSYFAALAVLLLLVNIPNIAQALRGDKIDETLLEKEVILTEYNAEKETKKLPTIPEPIKKVALKRTTIAFLAPKVIEDDKVVQETTPPDVEALASVEIGTKTVEGSPDGLPDGLDEAPPAVAAVLEEAKPVEPNEPFMIVEQMPSFPDGEAAMFKFIASQIRYPQFALENDIEGTVHVSFVVEKDGTISNIQVKRDIGGGCGDEAVRVIKSMPDWLPGKQRGVPVRVFFNLPIKFKIG